jgi:hypothetical protein
MPTVRRLGPQVAGLWVHELITRQPSTLGSTARILNTESISWVLIYTIDQDVDGARRLLLQLVSTGATKDGGSHGRQPGGLSSSYGAL